MTKSFFALITLEYPPQKGGIASYLGGLVEAAHGAIETIVPLDHVSAGPGSVTTRRFVWRGWPRSWPIISLCQEQHAAQRWVLVSHVFPVGAAAWIARLFGGPPYIVLFHGMDIQQVTTIRKRLMFRWICRSAELLIVNSEATKIELLRLAPWAKPLVLTPAVTPPPSLATREEARQKLGLDMPEVVILSIARLVKRKGIDHAIEAMARLQKRLPASLVVMGEGPDRERLEVLAQEQEVHVRWLGKASDEDKWLWLAAADLFVLPIRYRPADLEGFGIVFLEAALAGLPVIAGRSGGVEEAVLDEETGLIIDPENSQAIEDAIERLMSDEGLRQRLGERARERVLQDFQWSQRWEALKTVLEDVALNR